VYFVSDVNDDLTSWHRAGVDARARGGAKGGAGSLRGVVLLRRGADATSVSAFLFDFDIDELAILELDDARRVFSYEVVVVSGHEHCSSAHVDFY
jgi:hypothetical protein